MGIRSFLGKGTKVLDSAKGAGPYVLGAAEMVLKELDQVKDLIPLPWIGTAVTLMQGIVDIVRTMKDNEAQCKDLLDYLGQVVKVVLKPLRGRDEKDIPSDLRENLKDLQRRLETVHSTLVNQQQASWWTRAFRSGDTKAELESCSEQIKQALGLFSTSQLISTALVTDAIHRQGGEVHAGLDIVSARTEATAKDVTTMLEIIKTDAVIILPSELASTVLPPEPAVFFGREEETEKFVERLRATADDRFVIRGPGGLGKTTIVLKVAHHPDIQQKYRDRVFWVPCDQAKSPELLLELLSRSLRVNKDTPGRNHSEKILSVLHSSASPVTPHLIICDNFETPWDVQDRQGAIAEILQTVTSVTGVTLLMTMRGHTPPAAGRVLWTKPHLDPLSELSLEASRMLDTSIHSDASLDADLDRLLGELSYMPLAVRLVATFGCDGEVMPAALLKKWTARKLGNMLGQGQERTESVAFSVKLSIQSNAMKRTPEALTLLTILAQLPGGARREFIPQFAPFNKDFVDDAIATLMKVSLIQSQVTTGIITMLSPVRTVVLEAHPIDEQHHTKLLFAYYDLIASHSSEPGDQNHIQNMVLLRTEHVNCETLLRAALGTTPSKDSIKATYEFAGYLYWTFPDTALISVAVEKARSLQSNRKSHILADGLYHLGHNQMKCNLYPASEVAFKEAATIYAQIGNVQGHAKALNSLGVAYRMLGRYNDAVSAAEQAKDLFRQIGDVRGEANALNSLGEIYRMLDRYNDAVDAAEHARDLFRQIGNVHGEANAGRSLAGAYRVMDRFEDAIQAGQQALGLYASIGDQFGVGNASWSVAVALRKQGRLDEALVLAREALETYTRIGVDREIGIMKKLIAKIEASKAKGGTREKKRGQ